jgi:hypothetical protein
VFGDGTSAEIFIIAVADPDEDRRVRNAAINEDHGMR